MNVYRTSPHLSSFLKHPQNGKGQSRRYNIPVHEKQNYHTVHGAAHTLLTYNHHYPDALNSLHRVM